MQKPDWASWSLRDRAALWEVVALSLDADPAEVANIYRKKFRVKVDHPIEMEFRARIEVLAEKFVGPGWKRFSENSLKKICSLVDLVSFIVSVNWLVPHELVAIARTKPQQAGSVHNFLQSGRAPQLDSGLTAREQQVRAIEVAILEAGYPLLKIPTGGKSKLRKLCMALHSELFGGGEDPFNDAWKVGISSDPPRFRMADHAKFAKR